MKSREGISRSGMGMEGGLRRIPVGRGAYVEEQGGYQPFRYWSRYRL